METRRLYKFGPFSLDAGAKVLLRDGEPVRVTRKAVETLLALVEHAGQVMTKEQLIAEVWPDRIVDEANLTQNIAVLRRALQAEEHSPAHIETFPGRGYRIVGPVELVESGPALEDHSAHAAPVAAPPNNRMRLALGLGAALLAIGGAWWVLRTREAPAGEFHRFPVTRLAGKQVQPAVSPDGKRVAFVWQQDGARTARIWMQEVHDATPRMLTQREGDYSSPAWSPDGASLAYLRFSGATAEVVVARVADGAERVVTSVFPTRYGVPSRHLDWSPDGRILAIDDTPSARQPLGIFLIDVANGTSRRLTNPEQLSIGDVDPRFSPDGQTLLFVRAYHRAYQELFTVPVQGGTPVQLTSDSKQVSGGDWLPDSKTVVFASDRDGSFRIWRVAVGASQPARTIQATSIYADFPIQPSLARHAAVMVYSVLQHDFNIWRLSLDAAKPEERWHRVIASAGQDASPRYSPNGREICFRSDRSGAEQLWVSGADGSGAVAITRDMIFPSVGNWSPDGNSIVFNNARSREVFFATRDAAGKWSVRPAGISAVHPVFSKDGKYIYAGTKDAIVRFALADSKIAPVFGSPGLSFGVSADGRKLFFVREPASPELWGLDLDSGNATKVLDGLVPYCTSCWAEAPGGIYFLGSRPEAQSRQALFFHDLAGGRDRVVLDYPEPLLPIGSGPFSLLPGGKQLLCVRVDPSNAAITGVEPFR